MTTVNKILTGLILVAAIACCVLSVILYQQRIELRERADYLAKVTSKTAKIIDGSGEYSSEIDAASSINKPALSWQAYKAAKDENGEYTKWENQADKLVEATEKLVFVKQELAEGLIRISEKIGTDQNDGDRASINSSLTYSSHLQLIEDELQTYNKVKSVFESGIAELAKALEFGDEINPQKSPQAIKEKLSSFISHSEELLSRKTALSKNLQELAKSFEKDKDGELLFTPSWTGVNFGKADSEEINKGFSLIIKDMYTLNQKLYELKVANKMVQEQRSQLTVKSNVIEELNNENDQLKNINGSQKATIARMTRKLEDYKKNENPAVPEDLQAEVIEVNDRFNFLVIDKGRQNGLISKAELLIHNNGQYVCKAKVSKVLKNKAICEILPNPAGNAELKLPVSGNIAVSAR